MSTGEPSVSGAPLGGLLGAGEVSKVFDSRVVQRVESDEFVWVLETKERGLVLSGAFWATPSCQKRTAGAKVVVLIEIQISESWICSPVPSGDSRSVVLQRNSQGEAGVHVLGHKSMP